jgi:glycosyltransferase involved in cell wall biosynthesis
VSYKNDLSDFSDKILYYLKNREEYEKITSQAVDFFHGNWTWAHRADSLIQEFEKLL